MPYKCCVPNCKSNYKKDSPKYSVFSFPKDDELRKKWLLAICRENFIPTKYSRVCELHFKQDELERITSAYDGRTGKKITAPLSYPRLIAEAIPSQMPNCPKYMSSSKSTQREDPETRRLRLQNAALKRAIEDSNNSFTSYEKEKTFNSLQELEEKLCKISLPEGWVCIKKPEYFTIILMTVEQVPKLLSVIHIDKDLILTVYFQGVEIKSLSGMTLSQKTNDIYEVEKVINAITKKFSSESMESFAVKDTINLALDIFNRLNELLTHYENQISFLKEQVCLLGEQKNQCKYSWEVLIFCSLLHTISPHAYKFLRSSNNVNIPRTSTLQRVCSKFASSPQLEQNPENLLSYIASKFPLLSPEDKTVVLLMDEIHLKPNVDFKGGNIVGNASDNVDCATSACVFMVSSVMSQYKEVVHILPVSNMKSAILHKYVKDIIIGLENIGFEVVAVVSDNHSVNKKAMSLFSNPLVVQQSHMLILLVPIDYYILLSIQYTYLNVYVTTG